MGNLPCRSDGSRRRKYLGSNELKRSFISTQKKAGKKLRNRSESLKKLRFNESVYYIKTPDRKNVSFIDAQEKHLSPKSSSYYKTQENKVISSGVFSRDKADEPKEEINSTLGFVGQASEVIFLRQVRRIIMSIRKAFIIYLDQLG
jgi:hypothetical protein